MTADATMIPLGMPGRRFGVRGQLVHRGVIRREGREGEPETIPLE
jgi:hypothetical protein